MNFADYEEIREVASLFEREIPEYADGTIRIVSIARRVGLRTKVAVASDDLDIDPVGACVGEEGARIRAVVQALNGEAIDIVPFDEEPVRFVCNAIAPAAVVRVLLDDENTSMELIIPDGDIERAAGPDGQFLQLAAQLTGWSLSLVSESRYDGLADQLRADLTGVRGELVDLAFSCGYTHAAYIAEASAGELVEILGISVEDAAHLLRIASASFPMR